MSHILVLEKGKENYMYLVIFFFDFLKLSYD